MFRSKLDLLTAAALASVGRWEAWGSEGPITLVQVAEALGVEQMQIGPQIDPGVPWCHAHSKLSPEGLHIALKSGNFGGIDFFTRSFALLIAP